MNFPGALFNPGPGAAAGSRGYVYHDPRIALAVNVALAARRPLLVTGAPGSGKSTLAEDVASHLGWAFAGTTITSRTRQDDLVARWDSVRRLADAQAKRLQDGDDAYLVPGVLWWALDGDSARAVAGEAADPRVHPARAVSGTVVLLDEIDKAEPDLPNDLLGPLDRFQLRVPGRPPIAAQADVLVIITSNGERIMPPAFQRRCVVLELADDDPDFLVAVAKSHFGPRDDTLYEDIAARASKLTQQADEERERPPSVAEYLDTVQAADTFGQHPGSALWAAIEEAALRKRRIPDPGDEDG